MTEQTPPDTRRQTHRGWVTGALLLAMFMAAIEGTIVATAMPRIVADLGGFIVELAHWSWIFYLNLPIGVLAMLGVAGFLHEHVEHHSHRLDFPGALLLIAAIASFMVALLQGGTAWSWASPQSLGLFAGTLVGIVLLVLWEGRAKEPVIPLWLFKDRLIGTAGGASFFNGAMMLGYTAMVPTYVQGVLGGSAIMGGVALAAMSIGWPLASFTSGRVMRAIGYRSMAWLGGILTIVASLAIALGAQVGMPFITAAVFVVGMGLGYLSNAFIITVQTAVPWQQRGVATANLMFMRTLGSTVGVAALGALLNLLLLKGLKGMDGLKMAPAQSVLDLVNRLLEPGSRNAMAGIQEAVIAALSQGLHGVFLAAFALAVAGFIWCLFLPNKVEPARS